MRDVLSPPRGPVARRCNQFVRDHKAVRWVVDGWWFEHSRIASSVISGVGEALIYGVGFLLLPLPGFVVLTAARLSTYANEFHTAYLALRHRDFSLFNQPQIWERRVDGTLARREGHRIADIEREHRLYGPRAGGIRGSLEHARDFWTERKRLPGFMVGIGTPVLAFILGSVFGVPIAVVAAISYGSMAIQTLPQVRNGILSLKHKTSAYFDKPQTIKRRPREHVGISSPDVDGPAIVVRTPPTAAARIGSAVGRPAAPSVRVMPPMRRGRAAADIGLG